MPGDGEVACAGESAVQSEPGVKKFTWQELSKLNQRHNAHAAVRGKVRNPPAAALPHQGYHTVKGAIARTPVMRSA